MVLGNENAFKFLINPRKKLPTKSESFAGVVLLKVPKSGLYKIAIGSRAWIDLVNLNEKNKPIEPHQFSMEMDCEKIVKAGEFELSTNKKYALQLSSSSQEKVLIMISSAF